MKTGLVITTINQANKNIKNIDINCNSKKWDFCVIGDKKTPKDFKIKYGNYINPEFQKKLKFKFSKICPFNSYARKNIGYLILAKNRNDFIVETDDDNYPKKNFFRNKSENKSKIFRRSIFTIKNIKKGEKFSKNNIRVIRPGYGLAPKYFNKILNKKSPLKISKDEPLKPFILKNL